MATSASDSQNSYIDFTALLSPTFSAPHFANNLVTLTNNPTDTSLDLSTPLSRVLFDVQEIDTRIHSLTTKSALPILEHTQTQNVAAQRVLEAADAPAPVPDAAQVVAIPADFISVNLIEPLRCGDWQGPQQKSIDETEGRYTSSDA